MKKGITRGLYSLLGLAIIVFTSACHHEVAKAQPSAPPPPAAPTAAISADPAYILHGQSTTLSWQTANATDINIEGLGTVPANGSRTVYPPDSSTYELVAKGPGGTGTASARVTVSQPAPAASSSNPEPTFGEAVKDVFFDYNRFNIRADEMQYIQTDANYLEGHPAKIVVEGHCDERGTAEYNLALGAKRASAVQQVLIQLGVPAASIKTVSYGKEKPFCTASSEKCWQENRRGHFVERQ
ncbi:MAG TPA: peptidoglycan-associated lipoprotein Pal [Candidatus Acidoferrales bacterium]|nr:peptidoglycan-associated lipoprotein Pal [Candidatus Acidoferrales bacterium]